MKQNSKKLIFLSCLILSAAVMISWYSPSGDDDRNLKVLPKDISSDSLQVIMDEFVTSLNVNCAFCHAPKDTSQPRKLNYASDANPMKETTRTMLRMTNEMNLKYIKPLKENAVQLVNCNTCHRRYPMPPLK